MLAIQNQGNCREDILTSRHSRHNLVFSWASFLLDDVSAIHMRLNRLNSWYHFISFCWSRSWTTNGFYGHGAAKKVFSGQHKQQRSCFQDQSWCCQEQNNSEIFVINGNHKFLFSRNFCSWKVTAVKDSVCQWCPVFEILGSTHLISFLRPFHLSTEWFEFATSHLFANQRALQNVWGGRGCSDNCGSQNH